MVCCCCRRGVWAAMADKEDDVAVGAAKYGERAPLGTSAPGAPEKDYHEPQSTPFFEPREFRLWSFWRAGIAEFMASLLFLYITIQTVMGHDRRADPCLGVGIQGIACGGMIFALVYCTAGISGFYLISMFTPIFAFKPVDYSPPQRSLLLHHLGQ